jgi:GrpB-like predicted nucleotidyltransferase (UPF0157 family)
LQRKKIYYMKHRIQISNKEVVKETLRLLNDNPEWRDRYAEYAKAIKKKQ